MAYNIARFTSACASPACAKGGVIRKGIDSYTWPRVAGYEGKYYHPECPSPYVASEPDEAFEGAVAPSESPARPPAPAGSATDALSILIAGLVDAALLGKDIPDRATIERLVNEAVEVASGDMLETLRDMVEGASKSLTVTRYDGSVHKVASAHYLLPRLLYYAEARTPTGLRQSVYAHGPTGSGKTTAVRMAATILGFPRFASLSLNKQTPPSYILGYADLDPMDKNEGRGKYVTTDFVECMRCRCEGPECTESEGCGGCVTIDEFDNTNPNVITTLNTIDNGWIGLPVLGLTRVSKRFWMVCSGNTDGRGGHWKYSDRTKFDAATRNRFAFLDWGYDESLERTITLGINPLSRPWLTWVQTVRAWLNNPDNGIKDLDASPRASFAGARDLAACNRGDLSMEDVAHAYVFQGLRHSDIARILSANPLPSDWR